MPSRPKSETDLVDDIQERVKVLQARYRDIHDRWTNDLAYYYNRPRTLLKNTELSAFDPANRLPVFNKIRGEVELATSNMIGSRPEIFVRAFEEQWDVEAQRLADTIHYLWDSGGGRPIFRRVCRTASQIGTGFMYVGWENKRGLGKPGDICFRWVNPFEVYIDPDAMQFDEARYIFIVRYVTRQEAAKTFPLMKDKIARLDLMPATVTKEEDVRDKLREMAGMPIEDATKTTKTKDKDSDLLQYVEMWQDGGKSLVKLLGDYPVTEELATTGKDKETITYPVRSPFAHGTFPIVPFFATEDGFNPWGISDIHDLRDPQDHHNLAMQRIIIAMEALQKIVTKLYVMPDPGGVDETKRLVSVDDWSVIPIESSEQVPKMVQVQGLIDAVTLLMQEAGAMEQEQQEVGGQSDTMKGLSTPRVYSGRHAQSLQAAGEQRFGPRLDGLVTSMTRMGKMLVSMIEQFYTDDLNKRGFSISVGNLSRRFVTHDENGDPVLPRLEDPELQTLEDSRFEIYVQPQDEYPMSRQAQAAFLSSALQYGGADVEAILQTARVPGASKISARMGERLVAGEQPSMPWPEDVTAQKAQLARMALQLQTEQAQMQLLQQRIMLEQQAQQMLGYGQPAGGIPVAGPGAYGQPQPPIPDGGPGVPHGGTMGMPADLAQQMAEDQYQNIGQPPV